MRINLNWKLWKTFRGRGGVPCFLQGNDSAALRTTNVTIVDRCEVPFETWTVGAFAFGQAIRTVIIRCAMKVPSLYEGLNTYMLWCLRTSFHFYFTFIPNGVFSCTWKFIVRAKRSILSNFNPRFKKAFWISITFDRCRKCTEWPLKAHTYWLEVALSNTESARSLHSSIQLLHSLTRTIFIVRVRGHYIYVKDLKTYKYKVCRYVLKSWD